MKKTDRNQKEAREWLRERERERETKTDRQRHTCHKAKHNKSFYSQQRHKTKK